MLTAILPRYIDSTMISCFRSCPQKFHNEFNLGLRPAAFSVDLHAGSAFATGIEAVGRAVHESGLSLEHAFARGHAAFLDAWGDFVPEKDTPKTRERTWEAIEEYFATFPPLTDHIQPFMTNGRPTYEFTFAVPLEPCTDEVAWRAVIDPDLRNRFPLHPSGEPFVYCGRLDRLGQWSGKIVGQDEKTTTSIGTRWSDQWNLRSQFLGYCWALRQSGLAIDTIAVRGVGILKTKITIVEAIKTYSDMLINRWHDQLRRDMWRLRRAWDEGYFDFNLAEACTTYGGCSFNGLCASPQPESWHHQFSVRRWNPLEKNPIAEKAA
jgi:PD-(D/E)XK nuclease superfamily